MFRYFTEVKATFNERYYGQWLIGTRGHKYMDGMAQSYGNNILHNIV